MGKVLNSWTEVLSAISSAIAAITSILASAVALVAYVKSKKLEYETFRPYIIPVLVTKQSGVEKQLFLEIKNVGDAPAIDVTIKFESDNVWNWVRNPDYPFTSDSGISAIGPGESVRYFLGVIRNGNPLSDIESREIAGWVEFKHPVRRGRISDRFRTSLYDNRYKAK
jgi:hypothetical protein